MNKAKLKQALCAITGGIIVIAGISGVVYWSQDKERRELARRISEFGPRKGVPRTIDDLKRAIAAYEDLQEQHVRDASQTGTYWKILATRFSDKKMFLEAVKALEKAIYYNPADETLHYLLGLNASYAAKSLYASGNGEVERYFNMAEEAYLRAIELEPTYTQARYALAVLYVFELNKPESAVPQLLEYMEGRSGDSDAMFILARAFYMSGQFQQAIDWYTRAIPLTKDEQKRREAEQNLKFIRDNL
ncbi:MAG: tetratricopeptide repeat protein [Spirochaetaceae bacterium]|jgi:tetratricopeptide (TPR) repeat protein|nr:tetratricopeptide repeat protein [Spirochaetaceae bacterium]GMO14608.1 MAG: tetratricopeptide repeat protein [Termitinemataceae bacterium]